MKPASVLMAVNDFPPLLGGESTLYHALARHLPASEVVVMAPRLGGDAAIDARLPIEVARRYLPEHAAGGPVRAARTACAAWHLGRLLLNRRFRYVVCGQLLSLGVPSRLLARLAGVPYAVFVHGADLFDYHDRPPWGRLARWVVEGADTVVVNSRFTGALVERLLPGAARRIVVLPMGVERPAAQPAQAQVEALRARYDLADGRPVLLSVARLTPLKGHDVAIAALPDLLRRVPDLAYLVVGAGPARGTLERLAAEHGVGRQVIFTGAVPREELAAHYRLGTIFLLLSRQTGAYDGLEGFGLVFLEAAAHGLPCVGGDSGGVPEAVQDGVTGFLVPPRDRERVVAAVARLLEDPELRSRMALASRLWAATHSWDRSAHALRSLWTEG
jgi:phosphatidylinositol alpha-1,6-mannosyltransferase